MHLKTNKCLNVIVKQTSEKRSEKKNTKTKRKKIILKININNHCLLFKCGKESETKTKH